MIKTPGASKMSFFKFYQYFNLGKFCDTQPYEKLFFK